MRVRQYFASATTVVGCPALVLAAFMLFRAYSPMHDVEPIDTRDLIPDNARSGPTSEEVMQALEGNSLAIEIDPLSRPKRAPAPGRSWRRSNVENGPPSAEVSAPKRVVACPQ